MPNDSLARGAKSQVFPSNSHIKQSAWDLAFKDVPETHGEKKSDGSKRTRKENTKKRGSDSSL